MHQAKTPGSNLSIGTFDAIGTLYFLITPVNAPGSKSDNMDTVERNETFDLAYRFITETQENIFLTGKAGTGKTTLLKYLKDNSAKNMIVAAPTGVAAINAGGVTLHSLFQLPLHPYLPTESNKQALLQGLRYNKQRTALICKMEVLVIDEISMVRCDVIDAIDSILRSVRRCHSEPFGGVQILFIGDLYQLPPVARNEEWKILSGFYNSPFFFDSKAVKERAPLLIELNKIYRQKEKAFVDLLNKVRNNQLDKTGLDLLNEQYIKDFQPPPTEKYITLTSHNNQADDINQLKLQKLDAPEFTFKAVIEGEFPENIYPADANLVLKAGAQVMFIKNDPGEKKYFNGKLGVVSELSADRIIVLSEGREIELTHDTWENTRYELNRSTEQLEQKSLGKFSQFPLRLAWAITIHKSQGLTFDKVVIDAAASFSSGQVYVALSRCTSLNGIVLRSRIPSTAIYSNEQVVSAHSALSPKGSLADRFSGARQVFTIQLLSEIFVMQEISSACSELRFATQRQSERLNSEAFEWIRHLDEQVTKHTALGEKFLAQIRDLMNQEPAIEKNTPLQKRIQEAAVYFVPHLTEMKNEVEHHPLLTEHKEAATMVDEALAALLLALHKSIYFLQYCTQEFTLAGFLKHKLNLVTARKHITSYAAGKKQLASADTPNPELYYSLKNWRDKYCESENLPIYFIANHQSLVEVCTYLPLTSGQLQLLDGFGKTKADKYGPELLAIVAHYCNQYGLETNMDAKQAKPKKQRREGASRKTADKTSSGMLSLDLFKAGKSVEAIAAERGLARSTIEGHLTSFVKTGALPIDDFITPFKRERITAVIEANPNQTFTEIKGLLGDDFSFTELRAVVNHLLWQQAETSNA